MMYKLIKHTEKNN